MQVKIPYKSKLGYTYKGYEGEIEPIYHNESIYQSTIQQETHVDNHRASIAESLALIWCMVADSSYKPRYKSINLIKFEPKNYAKTN
jgi:hypothetical protein